MKCYYDENCECPIPKNKKEHYCWRCDNRLEIPVGSEIQLDSPFDDGSSSSPITGVIRLYIPSSCINGDMVQYMNIKTKQNGELPLIDYICLNINHETIHLLCMNIGENPFFDCLIGDGIVREPLCGL